MAGLSSLQYKHCCGDSWYRSGETNLPERMTQILSLKPELTEVMTWVSSLTLSTFIQLVNSTLE